MPELLFRKARSWREALDAFAFSGEGFALDPNFRGACRNTSMAQRLHDRIGGALLLLRALGCPLPVDGIAEPGMLDPPSRSGFRQRRGRDRSPPPRGRGLPDA